METIFEAGLHIYITFTNWRSIQSFYRTQFLMILQKQVHIFNWLWNPNDIHWQLDNLALIFRDLLELLFSNHTISFIFCSERDSCFFCVKLSSIFFCFLLSKRFLFFGWNCLFLFSRQFTEIDPLRQEWILVSIFLQNFQGNTHTFDN